MLVTPNGNVLRSILSATVVKKPSGSPASGTTLPHPLKAVASNNTLKNHCLACRPNRSFSRMTLMTETLMPVTGHYKRQARPAATMKRRLFHLFAAVLQSCLATSSHLGKSDFMRKPGSHERSKNLLVFRLHC